MKRWIALFLILTTLLVFTLPAAGASLYLVRDDTETLGEADRFRLESQADRIYEAAHLAVVTLLTDQNLDYETCENYLEDENCGYGANNDGLLFVIDFGDDSVTLLPNGSASAFFDEDTCDELRDTFKTAYEESGFLYDGLNAFYTACADRLGVTGTDSGAANASDTCPKDLLELTGTGKLDAHVIDRADLLSESEEAALNARIDELIDAYSLDIVILTEDAIGGYTPQKYADWFFLNHDCGVGTSQDGVLFLLSMKDRDWYLCTHGKGIEIFTDYGIREVLGESAVISHFSDREYYEGFDGFLDLTREFCDAYEAGSPYDTNHGYRNAKDRFVFLAIAVVVSFLIALAILSGFKKQLKTARPQRAAQSYVVPGSLDLRTQKDLFLYSSVAKVPKPKESSSGGGSSTHSTGGSSFGGGGGKF